MPYREFLEYLEANLDGYQIFMRKATQFQAEKNAKRTKKDRWDQEKMQKAAYGMWTKSMESLYNNLKKEIKSDFRNSWITFIEKNDIFEIVNDSISEIDFSIDVA